MSVGCRIEKYTDILLYLFSSRFAIFKEEPPRMSEDTPKNVNSYFTLMVPLLRLFFKNATFGYSIKFIFF